MSESSASAGGAAVGREALPATSLAVARAQRRLGAALTLRLLGRWLPIGAGVGAALVIIDALVGPASPLAPWWALLGAPIIGSAIFAWSAAMARSPSAMASAAALDRAHGLHDRLTSALGFEARTHEDPLFIALTREQAELAAPIADAKRAIPVRAPSGVWSWAALACVGALAGLFIPRLDLLRPGAAKAVERARLVEAERAQSAEQAAAALAEAQREIAQTSAAAVTPEQTAALEQIANELTSRAPKASEGRAAAAAGLDDAASRLDEEAQTAQRALDALGERLASSGKGGAPQPGETAPSDAQAFEDALRRGDFAAAAESLDKVDRALRGEGNTPLTDAEGASLRERLSNLADDLDASSKEPGGEPAREGSEALPPGTPTSETPPEAQRLIDQGVPEAEAKDLASETDATRVREALEEKGVPPEDAQRLADQTADAARDRAAKEEAEKRANELRDALREGAKSPDESRKPEEPGATPKQPATKQGATPEKQPGDPSGEKQNDKQDDKQNDKQGEGKGGQPGSKPQQGEKQGDKPGDKQGEQPGAQPGAQPDQKPAPGESPKDSPRDCEGQSPGESEQPKKPEGTDAPGDSKAPGAPSPAAPEQAPKEGAPEQPGEEGGKGTPQNDPTAKPQADGGASGAQPSPDSQSPDLKAPQTPGGSPSPEGKQPSGSPSPQPGSGSQKPPETKGAPGQEPQQQPAGAQPPAQGDQPQPPGGEEGLQRAKETLERLAKDKQGAEQMRQLAERFRKQGQELATDPKRRQEMEKWRDLMKNEGGSPPSAGADDPGAPEGKNGAGASGFRPPPRQPSAEQPMGARTEAVDARRGGRDDPTLSREEAERVAAEWFNPDGEPKRGDASSGGAASGERVREAAAAAERAIEEQSIPRRRADVVRKFFKKLPEPAKATPAPPGPSAPAPSGAPAAPNGGAAPLPSSAPQSSAPPAASPAPPAATPPAQPAPAPASKP